MKAFLLSAALIIATPAIADVVTYPQVPVGIPLESTQGHLVVWPYGMTKEEFGDFIEGHVRKAMGIKEPPPFTCTFSGNGDSVQCLPGARK